MTPRAHSVITLALLLSMSLARAQQDLIEVTVTAAPPVGISGFEGLSADALPLSMGMFSQANLRDIGAQRISDVLLLDASVTESYNLPAYWDRVNVRGFTLDNRYNYRRDGLPISAQTIIGLENKERIELLKGTSGMQTGTSAPGGLVNHVLKRPPTRGTANIRDATLNYGPGDTRSAALDLGGRFGEQAALGYRLNVAHTDLNPYIRNTQGQRDLVALAMDWRLDARSRLEWEFEQSHVAQMGVNFYSLWGSGSNGTNIQSALPAPVDGTRNITRQPNTRPGVFDGLTGSVRFKHQLDNQWLWTTHYGVQRLHAADRLVYAAGCSAALSDRFCSNGDFQIYDYNTENERRRNEVGLTSVSGTAHLAGVEHGFTLSVMRQRLIDDMPPMQTSPLLGSTNSLTGGLTPPAQASDRNGLMSNTRDATTEWAVKDRIQLSPHTAAWLGLRFTQLKRQSAMTDGTQATQDTRSFTTPWLAMTHQLDAGPMLFASAGQGIESEVVPNRAEYSNAGQALPTLRSHQHEMGIQSGTLGSRWQATWFDIRRPVSGDAWGCSHNSSCTRQSDGQAHHRGLELNARTTKTPSWTLDGSATWLYARRENATSDPSLNGQRPINVPNTVVRGLVEYRFASVSGLRSGLRISREGKRNVTEHGEIVLPAWTTFDLTSHYNTRSADALGVNWSWGIQNVTNKRYWREAPKQYGQYFLNPGAPRTFRASVQWLL